MNPFEFLLLSILEMLGVILVVPVTTFDLLMQENCFSSHRSDG